MIGYVYVYSAQASNFLLALCVIQVIPLEPGTVWKKDWCLSLSKFDDSVLETMLFAAGNINLFSFVVWD